MRIFKARRKRQPSPFYLDLRTPSGRPLPC